MQDVQEQASRGEALAEVVQGAVPKLAMPRPVQLCREGVQWQRFLGPSVVLGLHGLGELQPHFYHRPDCRVGRWGAWLGIGRGLAGGEGHAGPGLLVASVAFGRAGLPRGHECPDGFLGGFLQ